jgi:hypothetical protein
MNFMTHTLATDRNVDYKNGEKNLNKNTGFFTPNIESRFGMTATGAFRSQSSSKRDDFHIFNKFNKKELYGHDNEKLRETILNLKKELNSKGKEVNSLKIELNALNIEEKKKIKIIENILSSSGKSLEDIINVLDNNQHIDKIDLSANSVIKLREIYVINFLKSQVGQLKSIIREKDEEIKILKENSKVAKITQMDIEMQGIKNENNKVKGNIEKLVLTNESIKINYQNLKIEHENLYKKYLKKSRDMEKLSVNNIKLEEETKNLHKDKKKSEEDSNKYKLNMINMKAELKSKTDYCNFVKISEDKVTKLEKDKENLIKKIDLLNKEKIKLNFYNK